MMKVEVEINVEELVAQSQDFCERLIKGDYKFTPVKDKAIIARMLQTGLIENGLVENEDGIWTIGRRDGEHVLIAYKPLT